MAPGTTLPRQSYIDHIIDLIRLVVTLVYFSITGAVKAVLPVGVLPRKSVKDEVVLITGSGSGIGRLMAVEFAKVGSKLVLWDIDEKGNLQTKEMLAKYTTEAYAYKVDLSDHKEIAAVAERVKADVGPVNILVNNAGMVVGKKLLDCSDEQLEKTMAVNTNANFFTTKAFLGHMLEQNHGHIVVIASMAGKLGLSNLVDYCASKHGAVGFAEALGAEIAAQGKLGVHVTTVNPYYIDTGMFDGARTFAPTILPILKPEYVVARIMDAVLTNTVELYLPRLCYVYVFLASFLPVQATNAVSDYFKFNQTMDQFSGRQPMKA